MSIRLATINRFLNALGLQLVVALPVADDSWTEFRLMTRNTWLRTLAS